MTAAPSAGPRPHHRCPRDRREARKAPGPAPPAPPWTGPSAVRSRAPRWTRSPRRPRPRDTEAPASVRAPGLGPRRPPAEDRTRSPEPRRRPHPRTGARDRLAPAPLRERAPRPAAERWNRPENGVKGGRTRCGGDRAPTGFPGHPGRRTPARPGPGRCPGMPPTGHRRGARQRPGPRWPGPPAPRTGRRPPRGPAPVRAADRKHRARPSRRCALPEDTGPPTI